ncbi:hypothetical protein GCM10010307_09430 [Streptomyces vastus]|uniref:Uncharacterized protein n=1 Tax=Streptomyces vastus TaxID=285451 RepID=A0ABN3QDS1_9ACTN
MRRQVEAGGYGLPGPRGDAARTCRTPSGNRLHPGVEPRSRPFSVPALRLFLLPGRQRPTQVLLRHTAQHGNSFPGLRVQEHFTVGLENPNNILLTTHFGDRGKQNPHRQAIPVRYPLQERQRHFTLQRSDAKSAPSQQQLPHPVSGA